MKNFFFKTLCIVGFFSVFSLSCKNHLLGKLPEVVNAQYHPYEISGEHGYKVSFELVGKGKPTALIINKIQQKITPADHIGNRYTVAVIAETRLLQNHRIQGSEKENGIIFLVNRKEVFKPVAFERVPEK